MSVSGRTHVVIGAGPSGSGLARALHEQGRRVRVVTRSGRTPFPEGIERVAADVADADAARRACSGAAIVYGCLGLDDYRGWERRWPPILAGMLEGAASAGAPFVFTDNLYMYGPVDGPLREDLPLSDHGTKPAVRSRLTRMWQEAHDAGRVRAVAVRASDFYGPGVTAKAALGDFVVGRALSGKAAQVLGDPDQPHAFTYMPDLVRALVDVGDAALAGDDVCGEAWHAPTAPARPVREIVERVFREIGREPRVQVIRPWMTALFGLFDANAREIRELMFQWTRPYEVDDSKFRARFGWTATPLEVGIPAMVAWFRERERSRPRRS